MIHVFLAAALAAQLYSDAITAMSNLPQPHYLTYVIDAKSDGLQVDPVLLDGNVWLNIHSGSNSPTWELKHRTYDYRSVLTTADGRRYYTARSFFDPTWYGALRALREGMFNSQDAAAPRVQSASPSAPLLELKTITIVAAMGPGIYRVEDRGTAPCANGDPGHALHLVSRDRNPLHQLTDVIVDAKNMRFCMLRFALNSGLGFHGIMEEHYGDVGAYWMQTGGFLDGTLRVAFIAVHHGIWHYSLTNVEFPQWLEPQVFTEAASATP